MKKTLNILPALIATAVIFGIPLLLLAQTPEPLKYESLVVIPGITDTNTPLGFSQFVNAAYAFSISIAALLAVVKIIIAGMKWMLTDKIGSISEAKQDIQSALLGLLIILAAVLIIETINPTIF